jgi:hypothetical protein
MVKDKFVNLPLCLVTSALYLEDMQWSESVAPPWYEMEVSAEPHCTLGKKPRHLLQRKLGGSRSRSGR